MVEFKQFKDGAIIIADTFEELKEFKLKLNKDFPEHKYRFSNYSGKEGKHIATYYLNRFGFDNGG